MASSFDKWRSRGDMYPPEVETESNDEKEVAEKSDPPDVDLVSEEAGEGLSTLDKVES